MHSSTILLSISLIDDSGRIREDYSHVEELALSIKERGLISPVVVTANNKLVDGGSRLRACRDVLKWTEIPVVFLETMSEDQLRILEVEANIRRKDFTWQERVLAVARVHEIQTSNSILSGSDRWTQKQTGELLGLAVGNVNNFLTLASFIRKKDEEVLGADGVSSALKVLIQRKEKEANKLLAALTLPPGSQAPTDTSILDLPLTGRQPAFYASPGVVTSPTFDAAELPFSLQPNGVAVGSADDPLYAPSSAAQPGVSPAAAVTVPLSRMLLQGDCLDHMHSFPEGFVDHILTDIPYGIDMGNLSQNQGGISNLSEELKDSHTVDGNLVLMAKLFPLWFKITKPTSFVVFFYDLDHHEKLQTWATQAGFSVQRWPLVWLKTHSCLNQAAGFNFTKNYEVAMVLRKPEARLLTPQSTSAWIGGNDDIKQLLGHPFAKPLKLWSWISAAIAMKGQTIYDPFAGVGSSTLSLVSDGYRPLTSELSEDLFHRQVINVSGLYKQLIPNCQFS